MNFAWPMLWQSGLLIAIIFALDFALRRKIRAAIRYALWLTVLVKLLLPPSLAFPTNPGWWIHPSIQSPAIVKMPSFTVTYDQAIPHFPTQPVSTPVHPRAALSPSAWTLITSILVGAGLLVWLCVRWWQIIQKVRHAKNSEKTISLLEEVRRLTGLRCGIRLKLTEDSMSPAVCGLFRPVILLPQSLVEKLSAEQLRAVLLHEAIHLRRGDVWVNCIQALLQIFYWWHPLLWLANARIRRLREEAVDDAVMLALRDDAEIYAPTLLEVAKLAFNRPLSSLGLVGILESRSALRQRIERLINFSAPRKAGLTFLSLCGIFMFSAVALPMGQGPDPVENQSLPTPVIASPVPSITKTIPKTVLITSHFYWMENAEVGRLISDLKLKSSAEGSSWPVSPEKFNLLTKNLQSSGIHYISAPRLVTISGGRADIYVGNSNNINSVNLDCTPTVAGGFITLAIHGKVIGSVNDQSYTNPFAADSTMEDRGGVVVRANHAPDSATSNLVVVIGAQIITTNSFRPISQGKVVAPANHSTNVPALNTIYTSNGRRAIVDKLDRIRLERFGPFDGVPLEEVLKKLNEETRQSDPEKNGINFVINPTMESAAIITTPAAIGLTPIDPATGLPVKPSNTQSADIASIAVKIPAMTDIRLANALDVIVKAAKTPIKYSIMDYGIAFSPKNAEESPPLFARHFRVDPNIFYRGLQNANAITSRGWSDDGKGGVHYVMLTNAAVDMVVAARTFFQTLGVDLTQPGKSIFYTERLGELFVRGTEQDLDTIENAMVMLNYVAPQIHIKARFIEVPKAGFLLPSTRSNNVAGRMTGILSDPEFRTVLYALEHQNGGVTLAEPEVVTTSGRQTQMRATQFVNVITNYIFQEAGTNQDNVTVDNSILPQTSKIETGPVLDVVPYVLSDGYMINLTLIPSLTEFLGYDKTTNSTAAYDRTGAKIDVPKILPKFRFRETATSLNLWDGQTAVLGGLPEKDYVNGREIGDQSQSSDKEFLIFITATIVDAAGKRVHSDNELPFAQKGAPPQPPH